MYKRFWKRVVGFLGALTAILLLSPVFIIVITCLHFANKGAGVFFLQTRPGVGGKPFNCMKFKSMTDERGTDGNLLPDKDRITPIGGFIRKFSIDELPQLFNILKGDMAFIGPRPLGMSYIPYFNEEEMHRHDVRPGITGWAQVNGRTALDWPTRMKLDLEYVNHISLWLDIKIFFLTIYKVFKRENIGEGSSGVISFYDYREAEWAEAGRYDLIKETYAKSGRTKPSKYLNSEK